MSSSPDDLTALVRDLLAPALRDLGFRGSGRTFVLTDDHSWAVLGIQRSTSNRGGSVVFTVNLTVARKDEWERGGERWPFLGARPSGNSRYPVGTFARLGSLMPNHTDHWWTMGTMPPQQLSAEVVQAIRLYGIPWLRANMI